MSNFRKWSGLWLNPLLYMKNIFGNMYNSSFEIFLILQSKAVLIFSNLFGLIWCVRKRERGCVTFFSYSFLIFLLQFWYLFQNILNWNMNNVVSGPHASCVWYLRFYGTVGFRTFRGGPGFLNKIVDFGGPIFM